MPIVYYHDWDMAQSSASIKYEVANAKHTNYCQTLIFFSSVCSYCYHSYHNTTATSHLLTQYTTIIIILYMYSDGLLCSHDIIVICTLLKLEILNVCISIFFHVIESLFLIYTLFLS